MKNLLLVSIILLNLGLVSCDQNSACLDKDYNNRHAITTSKNNLNASISNKDEDTSENSDCNSLNIFRKKLSKFRSIKINGNEYYTETGFFTIRKIYNRSTLFLYERIAPFKTKETPCKNNFLKWVKSNNLDKLIKSIKTTEHTYKNNKKEKYYYNKTSIQWVCNVKINGIKQKMIAAL